jgi:hypothetical protein
MNELPKDRIVKFIDAILAGKKIQAALFEVYGDKIKDSETFTRRYERFNK